MNTSDLLDSSRVRGSSKASMLIALLVIASLVSSSSGFVTPPSFTESESIPDIVNAHGSRDGDDLEVSVLLINGSANSTAILRDYLEGNATYNQTEEAESSTDPSTWPDYDILVWAQGRKDGNASLETELREYVLAGGHLLIEGANAAEHAESAEFEDDVLHASTIDVTGLNNYVGQNLSKIAPSHPVSSEPNALPDTMNYTSDDTSRIDSDVCTAENGSVVVYEWDEFSQVNGNTVDNTNNYAGIFAFDDDSNLSNGGQIIFASFALSLLNDTSNRTDLVENCLDWLIPIELEEYYAFFLSPDQQDQNTNSGGTVIYEVAVMNNGTLDDTYDIANSAPPAGWTANLNQTSVDVEAGKNTTVSLRVTAPINAENGDYANISVWGQSQGDGDLTHTVHTNTTVNNEARADLEPVDIGPDGGVMVLGRDTTIRSLVRNSGDRDANNVLVTFYLDDNTTLPIGNDTIDVPAGEETEAIIQWNATDVLGDHLLLVAVDPGQNHPETDETNNELENMTTDWTVLGGVTYQDASYNLTGNLSVYSMFTLDNVTLMFNSTDGEYFLNVENLGNMTAMDSRIRTLKTDGGSSFRFQNRGILSLSDSIVRWAYYNGDLGDPRGGIEVYSSTTTIFDTILSDCGIGIWTTVSPTIINSTFDDLSDFGIYSTSGSPHISGCSFSGMKTAIVQKGGSPIIEDCEITDVSTGIFISQLATGLINGNSIHDLNGLERGIHISDASPLVTYNEVHMTSSALWIQGEDSYPMISWNDLSENSHNSAYCSNAYPTFERNIIEDNGQYGINIIGGGVIVRNSFFSGHEKRAILVHTSELTIDNVTFHGDDDDRSYDEGIFSFESILRLYNSSFDRFSFDLEINLTHSSTLLSINSSFETINRTGGSVLSIGWFLNIIAIDRLDQALSGADITIVDSNQEVVYQGKTDAKGHANLIPLISFNESDDSRGTREWFTPHRIDVDYGSGNGNDTVNLSEYTTLTIEVNRPPIGVLDVSGLKGTSETRFLFTAEDSHDDSNSIHSYHIDFGNGETTGWSDNEKHTYYYPIAGYFTATLLVRDYDGAISEPVSLEIKINNHPKITLPESITGKQGVNLTFDADVYDQDSWDNLHYEWDFGDGHNSTLISPSHAYADIGDYFVVLNVTDDHGGWAEELVSVNINPNRDPVANAGKDINVTFNNGANVDFISRSTDPDDDPLTFLWDFDDGSTSQQEDPNHFYDEPGTYNVTLTVTDDSNAQDTDVIQVNIIEYKITFQKMDIREGHPGEEIKNYFMIIQNNGSHDVVVNFTTTIEPVGWVSTKIDNMTFDFEESRSVTVTITIPTNAQMGISEQFIVVEAGGFEFEGSILIDVKQEADVRLSLEKPTSQSGDPGETLTYNMKVINDGSDEDSVNIQVSSFPPGWDVLIQGVTSYQVKNISPTNINYLIIQITITIPDGEEPGRLTVSIFASSVADPGATATIDIKTTVNDVDDNGDDEGISGAMIAGLIIVLIIIGAIIMSRRKQDLRYAEDEDEDDFGDDWNDTPAAGRQKQRSAAPEKEKPRILKCPKCATLLEVPSAKRPITIQCPGCGARAHIKK